ncbi:GumC family protein [Massilia sp. SYSU DXS3249]
MNPVQSRLPGKAESEDVNLIDILIVLAKHKRLIVAVPLVVAVLAAAASLLLPNMYRATTRLLPPQQSQSGAAALLSQLGGVASLAAGAAGLKNPSEMYVGMLRSRTLADRLIAKYDLKNAYDVELFDKARKELEENTTILSGKDGLITIDVLDEDRKRAAQIANSYVSELVKLTSTLAITEAAQRRMFYEKQLEQAKNNLASVEVALKSGLDTRGVISVDVESRAAVETVSRLRAQISAKEIQLNSMRAFVTPANPNFRRVEEELSSLRGELSRLENGRPDMKGSEGQTRAGLENIKLLRDVKYYQMLYELLAKQYELARLDEAKEPSIIQVLDPAIEPERKAKPQRALLVAIAAILGFFAAIGWAFLREAREKMLASPQHAEHWGRFKAHLRGK